MTARPELGVGTWLGIDIGSGRDKICAFCLVESDGAGEVAVTFERGRAAKPYPARNSFEALIDRDRAPTYLHAEVGAAVGRVLEESEAVRRWRRALDAGCPGSVGIDAPVALAVPGQRNRATERSSSDLFDTPDRATFESKLGTQKAGYYPINIFWKCIGFALYRWFTKHLAPDLPGRFPQETVAARTCPGTPEPWKIRETFPSDVYKRANGTLGTLGAVPRNVLAALVHSEHWQGRVEGRQRVAATTLGRLLRLRHELREQLEVSDRLPTMARRKPSIAADLWDAFTCAFTVCCEAHGGGEFHGWSEDEETASVLRKEGAILTVRQLE